MKNCKYQIWENMTCDPDRPSIQRLHDIGTVVDNKAPMFIGSVHSTQNCMKVHEYNTPLQSWNKKKQEFYKHIMYVVTTKQQEVLCCLHGGAGIGKSCHKSTIPRLIQIVIHKCWQKPQIYTKYSQLLLQVNLHTVWKAKQLMLLSTYQKIRNYNKHHYDMINKIHYKHNMYN